MGIVLYALGMILGYLLAMGRINELEAEIRVMKRINNRKVDK